MLGYTGTGKSLVVDRVLRCLAEEATTLSGGGKKKRRAKEQSATVSEAQGVASDGAQYFFHVETIVTIMNDLRLQAASGMYRIMKTPDQWRYVRRGHPVLYFRPDCCAEVVPPQMVCSTVKSMPPKYNRHQQSEKQLDASRGCSCRKRATLRFGDANLKALSTVFACYFVASPSILRKIEDLGAPCYDSVCSSRIPPALHDLSPFLKDKAKQYQLVHD